MPPLVTYGWVSLVTAMVLILGTTAIAPQSSQHRLDALEYGRCSSGNLGLLPSLHPQALDHAEFFEHRHFVLLFLLSVLLFTILGTRDLASSVMGNYFIFSINYYTFYKYPDFLQTS